jgi:hypothetical protein
MQAGTADGHPGLRAALARGLGAARERRGLVCLLMIGLHSPPGAHHDGDVLDDGRQEHSAYAAWRSLIGAGETLIHLRRDQFAVVAVKQALEPALDLAEAVRVGVRGPRWASVGLVSWDAGEDHVSLLERAGRAQARAQAAGGHLVALATTADQARAPGTGYLRVLTQ